MRSIVSARSLVSKGLIKRVRSGSSISVWSDPWLPTTHPRPANKNQHNLYSRPYIGLSHWFHFANLELACNSGFGWSPWCKNYKKYTTEQESYGRQTWLAFHTKREIHGWIRVSDRTDLSRQRKTTDNVWSHSWCLKGFLLDNTAPPKNKTFFLWKLVTGCISVRKKYQSERDTRGYILCQMRSRGGIDKPCVFLSALQYFRLEPFYDTFKSSRVPNKFHLYKYGSSFSANSPADRWLSVCMDPMVYLERME